MNSLKNYTLQTYDKVRYADTDRQGHVNNAVFSSYFETGRVELLFDKHNPLYSTNCEFVIVKLTVNLLREITWPGTVEIGTIITKIGNSSITMQQGLFQKDILVATADTVIVQMNEETRKSHPLSVETKNELQKYCIKGE